jgi:acyl-CoA reductase-like NAD-dependent aldehyde dehydrogenase
MTTFVAKPGTDWPDLYAECMKVAPEAFDEDRVRNLWGGQWRRNGKPATAVSPVDGTPLAAPPLLNHDEAVEAVEASVADHKLWKDVPLDERKARLRTCLEDLDRHRELFGLLLIREIGKPWKQSVTEVDRTLESTNWYLDEIDRMLEGRSPLAGPVSNIASWNYPINQLFFTMLIEALAGNAAIAKVPSEGGLAATTLAVELARRAGLPFTLISGKGSQLSPVLVQTEEIGALSFVGGRAVGAEIASALVESDTRHMLEQEGLNAWGIWEFSDWDTLAEQIRSGFQYGKQRCTAYPRYVLQRKLFDQFLEMYLPVVRSLRFGNPLAVADPDEDLPDLDFGPVVSAPKAREVEQLVEEAIARGGIPLYRGSLDDGRFIEGQDRSAYVAPQVILEPPRSSPVYHAELFAPVDTIVCVDTEAQLLSEMNSSNGSLVASLAMDDLEHARQLATQVRAFKIGFNKARSRGDKDEPFGGLGASWKGAFVGGEFLIHALTLGPPDERLYGNFPDYTRLPDM